MCDAVPFECLDAHDEEQTRQYTLRNEVKYYQKWTGHGDQEQETLGQVADALFNDMVNNTNSVASSLFIHDLSCRAERSGVERSLWN